MIAGLRMGDVSDFRNFMGAVIDAKSFAKISGYLERARKDRGATILAGGGADDKKGWFIEPTLIQVKDPMYRTMCEELFGPVLTVYVYADKDWKATLSLVNSTSPYALTGAVFAQERGALVEATAALRFAAGNFYVNDKPTGAVVGQQPFGGARASGTNDKAGSVLNLMRWISPRSIKETFVPATIVPVPAHGSGFGDQTWTSSVRTNRTAGWRRRRRPRRGRHLPFGPGRDRAVGLADRPGPRDEHRRRAGDGEDRCSTWHRSSRAVPARAWRVARARSTAASCSASSRCEEFHIDAPGMYAVVQPGLMNAEVKQAARQHGLWYPPDPSSYEFCSIGGNLATNAGGLCCVKYGVTTDYVLALEVVLADGRALRFGGRTIKDVAGYDLKRLFVGSEGTLGIITEATLRLRPLPPAACTMVATFADVEDAGTTVSAVMAIMRPATMELMDRTTVNAVERYRRMGLDTEAGATLIAQSDSGGAQSAEEIAAMERIALEHGATFVATTDDPDEGEMFLEARRLGFASLFDLGTPLIEDVGVPIDRIAELVSGVEQIAARHDTLIATVGHAGDGNFHPFISFDGTDPEAAKRADQAFGAIIALALELGGTITGEHGVGVVKAPYLVDQIGPDVLEISRQIKAVLDPQGILNPGKFV